MKYLGEMIKSKCSGHGAGQDVESGSKHSVKVNLMIPGLLLRHQRWLDYLVNELCCEKLTNLPVKVSGFQEHLVCSIVLYENNHFIDNLCQVIPCSFDEVR